jgi:hypothetical protein
MRIVGDSIDISAAVVWTGWSCQLRQQIAQRNDFRLAEFWSSK